MKLAGIGFLIIVCSACTANEQKVQIDSYFNLKKYFEKEADRLNKLNLRIDKSVSINNDIEKKQVKIKDFKNEFSTFIASDINKASWKGMFKVNQKENSLLYTTENEKIPVKKVEVHYLNKKLTSIQIILVTDNILYHSLDTLNYFPDSLYEIKKLQKIKLIKEKKYVIRGRF